MTTIVLSLLGLFVIGVYLFVRSRVVEASKEASKAHSVYSEQASRARGNHRLFEGGYMPREWIT